MTISEIDSPDTKNVLDERQVILVLGMHRSGTSATTRMISLLGADLPKNLFGGQKDDNEKGFWESSDIVNLNESLLKSAESSWDDIRAYEPDAAGEQALAEFRTTLVALLKRDFSNSPLFIVKDPRICRFIPLWLEALDQFGVAAKVVIPVRNPLEVAQSLYVRDRFESGKSLQLWLRHSLDAERATRDLPRSIITYQGMLDNWRQTASKIAQDLDISWRRNTPASQASIDAYLSPDDRHHELNWAEIGDDPDITDWVARTYDALLRLAENHRDQFARSEMDRVFEEVQRAEAAFDYLIEAQTLSPRVREDKLVRLNHEVTQLKREIRALRQENANILESRSWRITYPFRTLINILTRRSHDLV